MIIPSSKTSSMLLQLLALLLVAVSLEAADSPFGGNRNRNKFRSLQTIYPRAELELELEHRLLQTDEAICDDIIKSVDESRAEFCTCERVGDSDSFNLDCVGRDCPDCETLNAGAPSPDAPEETCAISNDGAILNLFDGSQLLYTCVIYISGELDNVVCLIDDRAGSCVITIDDEPCNSCTFNECDAGYTDISMDCSNILPGEMWNTCTDDIPETSPLVSYGINDFFFFEDCNYGTPSPSPGVFDNTFLPTFSDTVADTPPGDGPVILEDPPLPVATVATAAPQPAPTLAPQPAPTLAPQPAPTLAPQPAPTLAPQPAPTLAPQPAPNLAPQPAPTPAPTAGSELAPTPAPTAVPQAGPTAAPQSAPTAVPQAGPTAAPQSAPTAAPQSAPTLAPQSAPTAAPQLASTAAPQSAPTAAPQSAPTAAPQLAPTAAPQSTPTAVPQAGPTTTPQSDPTVAPTVVPSLAPTATLSVSPSAAPSGSADPTGFTSEPTPTRTATPSAVPTVAPSSLPTATPSAGPSGVPTTASSAAPSMVSSVAPSTKASAVFSTVPSLAPSATPSGSAPPSKSQSPSMTPSLSRAPSTAPSDMPSRAELNVNIMDPITLSRFNSLIPIPTASPSNIPSGAPSGAASGAPSGAPSSGPTMTPRADIIVITDPEDGSRTMSGGFRLSPRLALLVAAGIPFIFAFL